MKVIAINGSPRKGGNVSQCLDVMAAEFAKEGIEFEVLQPGPRVHPCMACYHCLNEGDIHCIQKDDMVSTASRRTTWSMRSLTSASKQTELS